MHDSIHMGMNVRNIRRLQGMKQSTFALRLGIAQQNVSKMEKQKELPLEKLEAAAKVLGITVETIKEFNEKVLFNNNIALVENSGQVVHPVKDIIEYFKGELSKKDAIIERQRKELEDYRAGRKKMIKPASKSSKGLRSVPGKRSTR